MPLLGAIFGSARLGSRLKLVALLSWYNEPVSWLAELAASLPKAHVAHLVALDGAFFLYPGALQHPVSCAAQADALVRMCSSVSVGVTVHRPRGPYMGNEVEKRNALFRYGLLEASEDDWFLILDGDMVVTRAPFDLLDQLERMEELVCETLLWGRDDENGVWRDGTYRGLVRALPDLHVDGAHHRYIADGHVLRCSARGDERQVPAGSMLDLHVEHRQRPAHRLETWREYARVRDDLGIESHLGPIGASDGPQVAPVAASAGETTR